MPIPRSPNWKGATTCAICLASMAMVRCQVSRRPQKPASPRKAVAARKARARPKAPPKKPKFRPVGKDVTAEMRKMNSDRYARPPIKFRRVRVTRRRMSSRAIRRSANGFEVRFPSKAPIVTPAVYKGKIYVSGGFRSKQFYSFHATTGKVKWAVNLGDDGPSAPACDEGVCVFNTESCTVFALDAETGKLKWSWWLGDPQMSSPTIAKGRVFTSYPTRRSYVPRKARRSRKGGGKSASLTRPPGASHVIAAFHLHTGKRLWQNWIDGDVMSAPIAMGNDLYITTFSGTVYQIDQVTGFIINAIKSRATSAPVVVGNAVYFTQRTDGKGAKQVQEGMVKHKRMRRKAKPPRKWKSKPLPRSDLNKLTPFGRLPFSRVLSAGLEKEPPAREDRLAGGGPYYRPMRKAAPYLDRKVQSKTRYFKAGKALDAANSLSQSHIYFSKANIAGKLVGQGTISRLQAFQGSRVLYFMKLNFNSMGDEIVCTHPLTGSKIWSQKIPGKVRKVGGFMATPPAAAGKYLFVGLTKGQVLQLEPRTGKKTRTYKVGSPIRSQPIIHDGWIYVGTNNGRLVAINTRNKALTGWAQWGGNAARTGIR